MKPTSKKRYEESEGDVSAHNLRRQQGGQAEKRCTSERPRTGGRETHLGSDGKHESRQKSAAVTPLCVVLDGSEREHDLPACRSHQNESEHCIQNVPGISRNELLQEQRSQQDARGSAQEHVPKRPPGNIAANDLNWHQNQFDRCRKSESDANGNRCRNLQEQDKNWHSDRSCTNPSKRDKKSNDKANDVWHAPTSSERELSDCRCGLNVNAALYLASCPPAGAWVVGIQRERRTRLTPDG